MSMPIRTGISVEGPKIEGTLTVGYDLSPGPGLMCCATYSSDLIPCASTPQQQYPSVNRTEHTAISVDPIYIKNLAVLAVCEAMGPSDGAREYICNRDRYGWDTESRAKWAFEYAVTIDKCSNLITWDAVQGYDSIKHDYIRRFGPVS